MTAPHPLDELVRRLRERAAASASLRPYWPAGSYENGHFAGRARALADAASELELMLQELRRE